MSARDSVLADYRSADGGETVTLTNADTGTETTVQYALREAVSVRESIATGGYFSTQDVAFHLGDDQILSANKPAPGHKITDASSRVYVIKEATLDELEVLWRCVCTKGRA